MRDRMSPEQLARAKGKSDNTNRRNALAHIANGYGVTDTERRIAEDILDEEVGAFRAWRLKGQAKKKARGSF
ncbi:hypothetical protein ACBJ59_36730 [Nonomuraea sp. MTCD27]|uniref:hypothetical protein n=1 Tax=Nonomuraea sp. MTCD27 TaxID=1676747 RepID=UPI0035BEF0FC